MKTITFLIPYFGKWPIWLSSFLVSCQKNESIKWIFFTDCDLSVEFPENVIVHKMTLGGVKELAQEKLNAKVTLKTYRKLCDLRPAYGKIFEEYIEGTDFWGFCDIDVIWGDIRKYITNELLENNEIVSSRKEAISGHFTIFKNNAAINNYYKNLPEFNHILTCEKYMWAEEQLLTNYLKANKSDLAIYWNEYFVNNKNGAAHQEYYLDRWLWDDGAVYEIIDGEISREVMYLHFINWKPNMKVNEVLFNKDNKQFYISYIGMHYNLHSKFKHCYNNISNVFNGYYINEKRRYRKNKIKSLIKRVKRKLKFN